MCLFAACLSVGIGIAVQRMQTAFREAYAIRINTTPYAGAELTSSELGSRSSMVLLMDLIKREQISPPGAARAYAYVAEAYFRGLESTQDARVAFAASLRVMQELFPHRAGDITILAAAVNRLPSTAVAAKAENVVTELLARMQTDGFSVQPEIQFGEHEWYVRNGKADSGAGAGAWKHWFVAPSDIVLPPKPPMRDSLEDRKELAKLRYAVRQRSASDLPALRFWHGASGYTKEQSLDNITPAGVWQNILFVHAGEKLDDASYARVQRLLALTIADAFIASWKVKYTHKTQRPSMRISDVKLPFADPPFPGYVSGHATISRAAAVVLSGAIPEYSSQWLSLSKDAKNSRLLAGIHFSIDNDQGEMLGDAIGQAVLQRIGISANADRLVATNTNSLSIAWEYFVFNLSEAIEPYVIAIRDWRITTENPKHPYAVHNKTFAMEFDQVFGCGSSWSDYTGDGKADLYVSGCGKQPGRLFQRDGGILRDTTMAADLADIGPVMAGFWVDYNGDGWQDLFLTMGAVSPDASVLRLFQNTGKGMFTDVTAGAGLSVFGTHPMGAAWADYDADGDLDVYIAQYGAGTLVSGRLLHHSEENLLFRNNGNGTFTELAQLAGVADYAGRADRTHIPNRHDPPERSGMSFQPVWFDYNNDGFTDLFVATDKGISPLYRNNGNGTFRDVTEEAGMVIAGTGMGVAVGDFYHTGCLSLYVTNYYDDYLWRNSCDGTFTEEASRSAVPDKGIGWGTVATDWELDGDLDVMVGNAYLPALMPDQTNDAVRTVEQPMAALENIGHAFRDIPAPAMRLQHGINITGLSKSVHTDGTAWYAATHEFNPTTIHESQLYESDGKRGNWLQFRFAGSRMNTTGIGARLVVIDDLGTRSFPVTAGDSFLSQSEPVIIVGFGSSPKISDIRVQWPGGAWQDIPVPAKLHTTLVIRQE